MSENDTVFLCFNAGRGLVVIVAVTGGAAAVIIALVAAVVCITMAPVATGAVSLGCPIAPAPPASPLVTLDVTKADVMLLVLLKLDDS